MVPDAPKCGRVSTNVFGVHWGGPGYNPGKPSFRNPEKQPLLRRNRLFESLVKSSGSSLYGGAELQH